MNIKHKIFIIFSLVIFFVVWYSKSKSKSKSKSNLKENMENQSGQNAGCENAPLFLAMKNSSEISELKKEVKNISDLVDQLQKQNLNEATDIITSMTAEEQGVSSEEIEEIMT